MDIIVNTTYNLEVFKALNRLVNYRGKKPTGRLILSTSLFVIILAGGLMISMQSREMLLPCLGVVGIHGICTAFMYLQAFGIPRIQYRQVEKTGVPSLVFTFGEDNVSWAAKSTNSSGSADMKYSVLHKAVETDSYFFLYQTINQIAIVDKKGIQNGFAEEIAKRLKTHLGRKYKRIRAR